MSVESETRRWLLRANALLRAIQLLPWLLVLLNWRPDAYTHPWAVVGSYLLYGGWSVVFFTVALRRDEMRVRLVFVDVAAVTAAMLVVGLSSAPGFALTWQNWTVGPQIGTAIVTTLYVGTRAGAVVVLIFTQSRYGLNIHYSSDTLPADIPEPAVDAIRHAVMEALNNVAKHAAATEVWAVATGEPDGEVVVTITDRGVGFDQDTTSHGTGLSRSIRDRMAQVGGTAKVHSSPGNGTTVEIRWHSDGAP